MPVKKVVDKGRAKLAAQFGDRLREIRTARGVSQAELAKAAGLYQAAVCFYELGQRQMPRLDDVVRLAAALGVELRHLLMPAGSPIPAAKGRRTRKRTAP
jgi:transcriptional regulator with XRE-family HTH domain